jgi:predicted dehydrogenase
MTVNIALVGLGYWGPNLARNFAQVRNGRLHTLCDAREDQLKRLGAQYPGTKTTTSFDSVLADPDVTAVVLATPPKTHHPLGLKALAAGKHLFVEKPLANSSAECEDLINAAKAAQRTLMVDHVFVYSSPVRRVRELIAEGELGDILYVYSQRLNAGQVRQDANALWNFAPHDLSILTHWLGTVPENVVARGYSFVQEGIDDVVFMTLDYPGGIGANVHISWLDPLKIRRMTVVGSEKMLVYDDVSADEKITIYDKAVKKTRPGDPDPRLISLPSYETFDEFQVRLRLGDVLIPRLDFVEPLKLVTQHFVDCILSGETPETDGVAGLQVVRTLEAAQRSLDEHAAAAAKRAPGPA